MYKHHADSLKIMTEYFRNMDGVVALIFGGSVAKGNERPDSDLDGMVVVNEAAYARLAAERRLTECIFGMCTYPEGYFDVKYMTKQYLLEAAEKGSEPTRNSFIRSRVLFSDDPEIEGILSRIPVFQKQEKDEKMLSFYADFLFNRDYFLHECKPGMEFARIHAIHEVLYAVYRMVLQEHEVLFPCNRRLEETVASINEETRQLTLLGRRVVETLAMEDVDRFAAHFLAIHTYPFPSDAPIGDTYIRDFEQWWRQYRPNFAEW